MKSAGRFVSISILITLSACGASGDAPKPNKPAKAEVLGHETELLKLTLTPDAERRLGIQTVTVGMGTSARVITLQGEIVVPGGRGGIPISAQTDLAALAANQARAAGDVERAQAEVGLARKSAARATALVAEEAGSVRARDEAQAGLAMATASLRAAQTQRTLLGSAPDALGRQGTLWVRAAAYSADSPRIDHRAAARVRGLGEAGPTITARPVSAPPSANAVAGTVDLYYAIPNQGGVFRVGQRVSVEAPATGRTEGLVAPRTAILNDIHGGEWVYVQSAPHVYERRRVAVSAINGPQVLLERGLARGDRVVTAGAAELFGTEFGAK